MSRLVRIEAPHFVAGVEFRGGVAVRAAPIVRYMLGWDITRLGAYCNRKGWRYG